MLTPMAQFLSESRARLKQATVKMKYNSQQFDAGFQDKIGEWLLTVVLIAGAVAFIAVLFIGLFDLWRGVLDWAEHSGREVIHRH